jgi:hypothetical protein
MAAAICQKARNETTVLSYLWLAAGLFYPAEKALDFISVKAVLFVQRERQ